MRDIKGIVLGVGTKYWVLVIVVYNVIGIHSFMINYVQNYPLECTTICIQYILLFFLTKGYIGTKNIANVKNMENVKFVKKLMMNTLIDVTIATLTFTSNFLFYNLKLNSTATH